MNVLRLYHSTAVMTAVKGSWTGCDAAQGRAMWRNLFEQSRVQELRTDRGVSPNVQYELPSQSSHDSASVWSAPKRGRFEGLKISESL